MFLIYKDNGQWAIWGLNTDLRLPVNSVFNNNSLSAVFIALELNSPIFFQRPGICNYCIIYLYDLELLLWENSYYYGPNAAKYKIGQMEKPYHSIAGQQYLLSTSYIHTIINLGKVEMNETLKTLTRQGTLPFIYS